MGRVLPWCVAGAHELVLVEQLGPPGEEREVGAPRVTDDAPPVLDTPRVPELLYVAEGDIEPVGRRRGGAAAVSRRSGPVGLPG